MSSMFVQFGSGLVTIILPLAVVVGLMYGVGADWARSKPEESPKPLEPVHAESEATQR
jgi:hypothetical protein